jgi:hypothetical protein
MPMSDMSSLPESWQAYLQVVELMWQDFISKAKVRQLYHWDQRVPGLRWGVSNENWRSSMLSSR